MNIKSIKTWFEKNIKDVEEDLYIRVLLWAHEKQETGFTLEEMSNHFALTPLQKDWVRKIFFTGSDGDRKFFEHLRNDETATPNQHFYSLNEKGILAAINYKGLARAEKNSERAIWFAALSIFLTALGLFLQIKQTELSEIQTISEQIMQARNRQSAIEFCKQNPDSKESGLYDTVSGAPASCEEVVSLYENPKSILGKIRSLF